MIASRRAASETPPSTKLPSESGPRWRRAADIDASRPGSAARRELAIPQIPHTRPSLRRGPRPADLAVQRLQEDAPAGGGQGSQVERDGAVGDPLQVVGELLGHRGFVAAAYLRE